ncbi:MULTISPECIES: DUF2844 domain-containing protein [Ramlibacter]|uniref:DUF2844 domain-containing protein n=1 Tax=Ramlibacter pinisoli TaxID=2682844 RepID=A0A6N8INW5_9BURK|nr:MULTISPECIES: DUF2844 domain-containing protein [Ramlibacter]MBA2963425.1 DUF2844 domain-containing protein [Ramlibacter sp. CGMCC 1.13660]MVQ28392.1 DUF2844 domain-containing protein [Ramlibacter pinisoli]
MSKKHVFAACVAAAAHAAAAGGLGDVRLDLPSVQEATLQKKTPAGADYVETQLRLETGTRLRVFRAADGVIFAASWAGPFLPDLREVLGTHFAAVAARQEAPGPRNRMVVRQDDVVLVSDGRLGAFQGQAWLPGQLPAGFDLRVLP